MSKVDDAVRAIETGAAVLRVLGPLGAELIEFLENPNASLDEPRLLVAIPELRSPAALERARLRSRRTP